MLGRELTKGGQLDIKRAEAEVEALSRKTGLAVHADRKVADLSRVNATRFPARCDGWKDSGGRDDRQTAGEGDR